MEKVHQKTTSSTRKRKRGERVFQFDNFCEPGQPISFTGSFQVNVKALLAFGHAEPDVHEGTRFWSFQLELHLYPPACVRLFVAEEAVELSQHRQCYYCRSVGWGHNMVCNKRYHFMLPSKGVRPGIGALSTELTGKGAGMASQAHYLMHGIMHSNGFGHLIAINGIEGGSEFISGHQILDLWDRICTALQLRKVSLTDVAKKGSMELRLIHGLAYGQPWFGQWGYKFGHGSYGVNEQTYQASLDAIRSLPLFLIVPHFACFGPEIPMIIAKYQTLGGHSLLTLADLIRFMIELSHRLPSNSPTALDYYGVITEPTCRWSIKRVEMATQVIVGALKKSEYRWVTRQEVRDAARAYIGDTGLLDYVLKSLGNHIVGNYIIRRMVNPITKVLEYSLQDMSSVFPSFDRLGSVRFQVTRLQLIKDMFYLYKHILRAHGTVVVNGMFGAIPMAVRVILDTKHLVKDYSRGIARDNEVGNDEYVKLTCTIRLVDFLEKKELPPCEIVVLEHNATFGHLKRQVENKFKELYLGLEAFVAESVAGVKANDTDLIVGMLEPGTRIVIEGKIICDMNEEEVYEGCRVVDCHCGAKEDDGEPMVCCDICEIWQHTRCAGIIAKDEGEVPHVFLCISCENNIAALPSLEKW